MQKFGWQWCDYNRGLGVRWNHLENCKRHKKMQEKGREMGNTDRMKSGWLTWKVNVCSVKMLMDWAALPSVCVHECVCAREGRMVNAIVFAHVSVWTVTSRTMNMHACVHHVLPPERLITQDGWSTHNRTFNQSFASLQTVHENVMCKTNKQKNNTCSETAVFLVDWEF